MSSCWTAAWLAGALEGLELRDERRMPYRGHPSPCAVRQAGQGGGLDGAGLCLGQQTTRQRVNPARDRGQNERHPHTGGRDHDQWNLWDGSSKVGCKRVRAENATRANKEPPDEPQAMSREQHWGQRLVSGLEGKRSAGSGAWGPL